MSIKSIIKEFDEYDRLLEGDPHIGAGGQGSIYKVQDKNGIVRALKIPESFQDTNSPKYKRALAEVEVISSISHENIIKIIEYKEIKEQNKNNSKKVCYIMPMAKCSLREFIKTSSGDSYVSYSNNNYFENIIQKLEILTGIVKGLTEAHNRGIVHRDLKPENILLTDDNLPLITDFGISHFPGSHLTKAGDLLANRSYLSPEQKKENSNNVNQSSDIYALGLIINEIFTGQNPSGLSFITPSQLYPELIRLDNLIERMISYHQHNRPSLDYITFEINYIKDSFFETREEFLFSKIPPSEYDPNENLAIINQAISDISLAQTLSKNPESVNAKNLNSNYHSNIHYKFSENFINYLASRLILDACEKKFNYEATSKKWEDGFNFNLDSYEDKSSLDVFLQRTIKYRTIHNICILEKAAHYFIHCKDYHRREINDWLDSEIFINRIADYHDSPILYLLRGYLDNIDGKYNDDQYRNLFECIDIVWHLSSSHIKDFAKRLFSENILGEFDFPFLESLKNLGISYHNNINYQNIDLLFENHRSFHNFINDMKRWIGNPPTGTMRNPYIKEDAQALLTKIRLTEDSVVLSIDNQFEYGLVMKYIEFEISK